VEVTEEIIRSSRADSSQDVWRLLYIKYFITIRRNVILLNAYRQMPVLNLGLLTFCGVKVLNLMWSFFYLSLNLQVTDKKFMKTIKNSISFKTLMETLQGHVSAFVEDR
jgi:hypothetical protein